MLLFFGCLLSVVCVLFSAVLFQYALCYSLWRTHFLSVFNSKYMEKRPQEHYSMCTTFHYSSLFPSLSLSLSRSLKIVFRVFNFFSSSYNELCINLVWHSSFSVKSVSMPNNLKCNREKKRAKEKEKERGREINAQKPPTHAIHFNHLKFYLFAL